MGKSRPELGMYRAVLIGIDTYQDREIPNLATPVSDCKALQAVLEGHYGFRDTLKLLDEEATAYNIDATMRYLVQECVETDSLLIYFAGHGVLDDVLTGAWVVHDSKYNHYPTYMANEIIQKYLKALPARHVLLISDSCYAGSLFAEFRFFVNQPHYADLYQRKSRWCLTSGGKTPVLDGGDKGNHSVFAGQLIRTLANQTEEYVTPSQLFQQIAPIIGNNHEQKPKCGALLNIGDEMGAFLFARRTPKKQAVHEEMEVVLEHQFGSLVLSSAAGGLLLVDGKRIGSLAHYQKATLNKVLAGPHDIVIQADGYEEIREAVVVRPNQQLERNYEPAKKGLTTLAGHEDPLEEAYNLWQGNNKRKIDIKKARGLLEQEAAKGDPSAKMWIARHTYYGDCGFKKDQQLAKELALAVFPDLAAKPAHDSIESLLLGECWEAGLGTANDLPKAVRAFRSLAEKGDVGGQYNLGWMYRDGRGVTQDDKEAVKWYRLAADQGHAGGQISLGWMYRNGRGVTQDDKEAVKWYRLAADQGLALGQFNLGWMYEEGRGVTQDDKEAVKWYRLAADQGLAEGQTNLGWMYKEGGGVTQDDKEAVKWYRLAADQGEPFAQCNLAEMYEYGKGVPKDRATAVTWYQKSARQGQERAQKALKRLGETW